MTSEQTSQSSRLGVKTVLKPMQCQENSYMLSGQAWQGTSWHRCPEGGKPHPEGLCPLPMRSSGGMQEPQHTRPLSIPSCDIRQDRAHHSRALGSKQFTGMADAPPNSFSTPWESIRAAFPTHSTFQSSYLFRKGQKPNRAGSTSVLS